MQGKLWQERGSSCQIMTHADKCLASHDMHQLCYGFVRRLLATIGKPFSPNDFVSPVAKMLGINTIHQMKIYICDSNGKPDESTLKTMYVTAMI